MKLEVKKLIYRHQLNNNFCLGPLNIESESYLKVIGANGSGKTTFLKCLAGVYKKSEGNMLLAGKQIAQTIWVGAEAAIYWDSLTAKEHIILTAGLYGVTKDQVVRDLQKYNLDYFNQNIFSLSTGQKKIVSIIASVISRSALVILDEPDSNLDSKNREFLYKLILDESSLGKQFFLFTSHINSDHFLKNKTIELNKGSVVC